MGGKVLGPSDLVTSGNDKCCYTERVWVQFDQLPFGWFSGVDKASQKTIYWRKDSKGNHVDFTWDRPIKYENMLPAHISTTKRVLKDPNDILPPGWKALVDPYTGKTVYA